MYNRERKAIFFDIDGTLLIPGEGIHESVREALRKVRNHGHQVFIATGRAWCCLPEELQDVELDGLIASAGSDIWFHGQNVYRQSLPEKLIRDTCQILKEMDAVYVLEGFDRIYVSEKAQRILLGKEVLPDDNPELVRWKKYFRQKTNLYPIEEWTPEVERVPKITFMLFHEEQVEQVKEILSGPFHVVFFPAAYSGFWNGELISRTADKGTAIQNAAELLHIGIKDTIAFGDSMNDYEMIEKAGCGVVMANGDEYLKTIADRICESVQEDGVVRELERMHLI